MWLSQPAVVYLLPALRETIVIKFYEGNHKGRDFVVGDIHGCYDRLMRLLDRVKFDYQADRLFSVGDLIDRGPKNADCMRLVQEKWFHAVRGNHEEFLIRAVLEPEDWLTAETWKMNGGTWAQGHIPSELADLAALAASLPLVMVVGDENHRFGVLHAEWLGTEAELLAGNYTPAQVDQLQWGRSIIQGEAVPSGKCFPLYVGHTPSRGIQVRYGHCYLDTGSFIAERGSQDYGLSMVCTGSMESWKE